MKANPTEQEPVTFALEPDTMGCVIGCLPYIIRERAYQLFEARGGQPGHELDDWLQATVSSRLEEYPLDIADGHAHVEAVSKALSTFGREVRKTIDEADELQDADTADMFTEISRGIDKWLWFVEAHSQASK